LIQLDLLLVMLSAFIPLRGTTIVSSKLVNLIGKNPCTFMSKILAGFIRFALE